MFSDLEKATLSWTYQIISSPHIAYGAERKLRDELTKENRRDVEAGIRRLDTPAGIGLEAAYKVLEDHQIAELAMLIGHMDGLGRALTMLHLESEDPVQIVEGVIDQKTGGITPKLDKGGNVIPTGYFNNRMGLFNILSAIGTSSRVLTFNELLLNPKLNELILQELSKGKSNIHKTAKEAVQTGEF